MRIEKELYRQFEQNRLVRIGAEAPKPNVGAEAPKPQPDVLQQAQDAAKDMVPVIKQYQDSVIQGLNRLVQANQGAKEKPVVEKFAQALAKHATDRFNTISSQYKAQHERLGVQFETSDQARQLQQQAKDLHDKIKERLGRAPSYLLHQARQDTMQQDEALATQETPQGKEAKEAVRQMKIQIITEYFNQAKETKGMNPKVRDLLARYIVEGNMVKLEIGDIDNYTNLDGFFRDVDQYNESIGNQLKDKLPRVIAMFLAEAPNPEANQQEITTIHDVILKNDNLKTHYGTIFEANSWPYKVCTALAKRFDIRFKDGKVSYATDLVADPTVVYDAEGFEKQIYQELFTNPKLYDPKQADAINKEVDKGTEWLTQRRQEISQGLTWIAGGGKVTEWSDIPGHESMGVLAGETTYIRGYADQIEARQNQKEAQKRQQEAEKQYQDGFTKVLVDAGITQDRIKGFSQTVSPVFTECPTKMVLHRDKDGEKMDITVEYSGPNVPAKITLHMEGANGFNQDKEYTNPAEFKAVNLETIVKETTNTIKRNRDKYNEATKALEAINMKSPKLKGLELFWKAAPEPSRFMDPSYTVPVADLRVNGVNVGHIVFKDGAKTEDRNAATIKIEGQPDKPVQLNQLESTLADSMKPMQKLGEQGQKNRTEMEAQVSADLSKLQLPEGLTFQPRTDQEVIPPDYATKDALMKVGTINKSTGAEAAQLYIKVSDTGPREYVLKVDGKPVDNCKTIDEVKKYLTDNKDTLAHVPAPEPKVEPLAPALEPAKANLIKIVHRLWGEKMAGIKDDNPSFQQALNSFLTKLAPNRAADLGKPGAETTFQLTEPERGALQKAFAEAFGKVEAVDAAEVKLVTDLPVRIGDQAPTTFGKVFGENLAKSLSMRYAIRPSQQQGKINITDTTGQAKDVDARGLAEYLPDSMRTNYLAVLDNKASEEQKKQLTESADGELKTQEAAQQLSQIMRNPRAVDAFKKMGIGELIASLAQLWKMFQEAIKTGDWQTLTDGVNDFNSGKNPVDRINQSKESYAQKIGEINDTGKLLSLYAQPYGPDAKALFGDGPNALPYRVQLKQAVRERFEQQLGIDISDIEVKTNSQLKIKANRGAKQCFLYLEKTDTQTFATMDEIKLTQDGKEYTESRIQRTEIKDLASGDKNLADLLKKGLGVETGGAPAGGQGADTGAGRGPDQKPQGAAEVSGEKAGKSLDKASPAEKRQAQARFNQGFNSYYNLRKPDVALTQFRDSYGIVANPQTHLMIAVCLADTNQTQKALVESRAAATEADAASAGDSKFKDTAAKARGLAAEMESKNKSA